MVERLAGPDCRLGVACGLRGGVCVEGRSLHIAASRPKSSADYLVGIGLPGDGVCSLTRRGAPSGKARNRQVETTPEKMHGAVFADESGAEFFEDGIHQQQDAPEAGDIFSVIG